MKGHPYSLSANPSPGRTGSSYQSRLVTSHLELRPSLRPARSSADIWLTPRDTAILGALHAYRYLDRYQLQGLFFEVPRSCQYRLAWLAEHDLVHAWRAVIRPGHIRRATIYLLSTHGARAIADWRDEDLRIYVERADHAARRRHHIVHDLAANQLFVDLALATRGLRDGGLYHWVGEHGVIRAYGEDRDRGPIPDGWGRLLLPHGELLLHLEWDRGSEQTRRLHAKVAAYARYFRDQPEASCNQVLFVGPTDERERQILGVVRRASRLPGSVAISGRRPSQGSLVRDRWERSGPVTGSVIASRSTRCPHALAAPTRPRTPSRSPAGGDAGQAGARELEEGVSV